MAEGVAENVPFACERAIDENDAGDRVDDILIEGVDAAGPKHPAELAVEEEEADEAEPEDRHRIAEEADEPHHMVEGASLLRGRHHARRHPDRDADQGRDGGELEGRREEMDEI